MADNLRDALRTHLVRSMKSRDREAVSVLRVTLAAIDNAEAVEVDAVAPAGALEESPRAGAAELPRRQLTEAEVRTVVESELAERRAAAASAADEAWRREREREIRLLESMLH